MSEFVSFNHQILPVSETNLSAASSASLYGKGVFTTVAIYNSKPFLWNKHWQRLTENAEKIGIDLSEFSAASVKNSLTEIIKNNSLTQGRARLTFFDESPSRIWSFETEKRTNLLMTTAEFREVSDIKLTVSSFRLNSASPLANIKSCNYLEHILAFEEAKKSGFDEAVRLNERGEITSACLANIFWLKDQKIYTPNLETGCLAGTTREFLLENFEIFEVQKTLAELEKSEGIFLTSSGIGLLRVRNFGKKKLPFSDKLSKLASDFSKLLKSFSKTQ